jgi:hypothetical protein
VVWTTVVLWTGGVLFYVGGLRVSSRGSRNALLLTVLCLVLGWALGPSGQRTRALVAECERLLGVAARLLQYIPMTRHTTDIAAAFAAVIIVVVGITEGAFIIGGSDSYGYVSQAHLWVKGELRQDPLLRRSVPADIPLEALSPLGYRPAVDRTTIAPTYSPGLPMVMAVFERVAGRDAVFWVVPLLGGVLVWTTYLLGRRAAGPLAGVVAAVLVATNPPVLLQLTTAPMSDLPAAAWWALALLLAAIDRRDAALGSGVAAGLAILTRPNLVPVAVVVGLLLLWRLSATGSPRWRALQQVMLFGVPAVVACLTVAALNQDLWGSMLTSGYGSLATQSFFVVANVWPNLLLYPRVIAVQMPVVIALPLAAFLRRGRDTSMDASRSARMMTVALWACVVAVAGLYAAYPAFDAEFNLRFLLPLVAPLIVLSSVAALSLARRVIETYPAPCVLALVILSGYGVDYARDRGAFEVDYLQKYSMVGEYVKRELPERTVLLSMLHSGSANYYSGRPTLRWDLIPAERLDRLVDELTERGYAPYLVLDRDERAVFQSQYRGQSRLAALDWKPVVSVNSGEVEIYAIPPRP